MTDIKQVPRAVLEAVVSGRISMNFELLALRILLTRMQKRAGQDRQAADACVTELVAFFEKNQHLPNAQRDINNMLSAGGHR